jgi:hypothetical protein
MKQASLELKPAPRFVGGANGEPKEVNLDPAAYVALLVRANVTDPALWPPGMQEGATWLARIRAIERRCIAKHGEFDWEKLSAKLQNEYDDLCALLDRFRDTGESIPFSEYKARRAEYRR